MHYEKVGSEVKCIETEIPFEVPDSWEWSRLSALGTFAGGKTPSTANCDFWGGDVLWVTSKDMKTKYIDDTLIKMSDVGSKQMQLFPPDSLLMVVRSGILRRTFPLAILKTQATVNQDIKVCSLYLPFMAEYIYNYLKASELGILTHCSKSGTTVESVNVEDIKNLLIAIPPETEQRVVAHTISLAFAQIEAIELDKINLQSIIDRAKSKILDLAIRGKLVPQDPADESASVLLERIRAEKEQLIKAGKIKRDKNESYIFRGDDKSYYEKVNGEMICIDAEVPFPLPDSWEWVRLSSLGSIVGGGTPKTNEPDNWDNGTIAWITPADLSGYSDKYISRGARLITEKGQQSSSTQIMPAGSILFSSRAPIGYTVISTNEVCTNQGFKSVVPYILLLNDYVFYYLKAQVHEIQSRASGTTFKEISGTEFGKTMVSLPPLSEQIAIVSAIEKSLVIFDAVAKNLV